MSSAAGDIIIVPLRIDMGGVTSLHFVQKVLEKIFFWCLTYVNLALSQYKKSLLPTLWIHEKNHWYPLRQSLIFSPRVWHTYMIEWTHPPSTTWQRKCSCCQTLVHQRKIILNLFFSGFEGPRGCSICKPVISKSLILFDFGSGLPGKKKKLHHQMVVLWIHSIQMGAMATIYSTPWKITLSNFMKIRLVITGVSPSWAIRMYNNP